jgi:hypothetical protein
MEYARNPAVGQVYTRVWAWAEHWTRHWVLELAWHWTQFVIYVYAWEYTLGPAQAWIQFATEFRIEFLIQCLTEFLIQCWTEFRKDHAQDLTWSQTQSRIR